MSNFLYVGIVFGCWAGLLVLIRKGWRHRESRQRAVIGELPVVPDVLGPLRIDRARGLYVGSTVAPSWQDRIVAAGLGYRAQGSLARYEAGILVERSGTEPIWIPQESIVAVRTERGLAGKVLTADGLLVIRWILPSGTEIDTGFRADNKDIYHSWTSMDAHVGAVDRSSESPEE